jgi:hypothetical protein
LRQDDLKDIARADVFLCPFNRALKLCAAKIAARCWRWPALWQKERELGRLRELAPDRIDRLSCASINLLD